MWDVENNRCALNAIKPVIPELLNELKYLLDDYFKENRPLSYYNIILGDWCINYAHFIYACWIKSPSNIISSKKIVPCITNTAAEFLGRTTHDSSFRKQSVDNICLLLDGVAHIAQESPDFEFKLGRTGRHVKSAFRSLMTRKPKLLITQPYVKYAYGAWARSILKWRNWARWDDLDYKVCVGGEIDMRWRVRKYRERLPASDFNSVAIALIPYYIPTVFVEGHVLLRSKVLSWGISTPRAVYSAVGLHGHHSFKMLLAEWKERGTTLLYHQHGGGYGLDEMHVVEQYEVANSDRFYTYGWGDSRANIHPLSPVPPIMLSVAQKWSVLLVGVDCPMYSPRFEFSPNSSTIERTKKNIVSFLSGMPSESDILIRPYPRDFGNGMQEAMREAAPHATFDDVANNVLNAYSKSRLVVHAYLSTGFLETISMDIPSICIYDPNSQAFRDDAIPYIEELERVGVLFRSGRDAAILVNGLGRAPEIWWKSPEIQSAVMAFRMRYANFRKDWAELMKEEFLSVTETV